MAPLQQSIGINDMMYLKNVGRISVDSFTTDLSFWTECFQNTWSIHEWCSGGAALAPTGTNSNCYTTLPFWLLSKSLCCFLTNVSVETWPWNHAQLALCSLFFFICVCMCVCVVLFYIYQVRFEEQIKWLWRSPKSCVNTMSIHPFTTSIHPFTPISVQHPSIWPSTRPSIYLSIHSSIQSLIYLVLAI